MKEKRGSKKAVIIAVLITFFATVGGIFLALWLALGSGGLAVLEGIFLVNTRFVGPMDRQTVADSALTGMVKGLGDRWSYYLDPDWYQSELLRRENVYVGVGITVTYDHEEGLYIKEVAPDGPAEAAGVLPGEILTAVDGVSTVGEGRDDAVARIKGERGTTVALTLLSADGSSRTVTVTRGAVKESPVRYELLEDGVGYVKLENFNSRSAEDFKAAVDALLEQGAAALVFDVRNNGGGYVDELTDMLDYLLPEGPVFRMRSRSGREKVFTSDAAHVDLPMAVLVNADSYSAAEIFAGELREAGAAVVVGVETSGKGYAQITYPVLGGGALGISTYEYVTGGGVSLVGTGVTLDADVDLDEERAALLKADALPHGEDAQLSAALELLGK